VFPPVGPGGRVAALTRLDGAIYMRIQQ
jgi:hypothetical protein